MLQLRRGDWSNVPKGMRGMNLVQAIYNLPMFVSSVWWYSIVGFYIYLVAFITGCLALTPFVLALGTLQPLSHRYLAVKCLVAHDWMFVPFPPHGYSLESDRPCCCCHLC